MLRCTCPALASLIITLVIGINLPLQAADGLEEQIQRLNQAAKGFRDSGDFEKVEKTRRERWALIAEHAKAKATHDCPWVEAYRAIELVDGSENNAPDAVATGLIDGLKYKEACDVLWNAFTLMQNSTDGPLLGELAVRLFEVAQQARGIYNDALDPSSSKRVADTDRIKKALTVARERDPCCVLATPMLHYLTASDPKEAFLRAEVRANFKQRQRDLVRISHPLIVNKKDENNNEHTDVAVMPWHAPVELDKARSLQELIADLDYTSPLTPDIPLDNYVIPGARFRGFDALGQPFQLVYGKLFIGRKNDETGRLRSAAFFLNKKVQRGAVIPEWDHRYLELLWRVPTDDELAASGSLRRRHELLAAHPVRRKFTLGKQDFYIYDFPVRDTEQLIKFGTQIICVKSVDKIERMKHSHTNNRPDAVTQLLSDPEALERSPFANTPAVVSTLISLDAKKDPTKHSLTELTRTNGLNPLLVVSEKGVKDKDRAGPATFPADDVNDAPFLKLENGKKLFVAIEGRPEAPCCWIQYAGATAYMPLMSRAIPYGLLLGSLQGKACVALLEDAGYTKEEAAKEIVVSMEKKNDYVPAKFKKLLDARVNSLIKGQRLQERDVRLVRWAVFAEMLEEKGWQGTLSLAASMNRAYDTYGFRYLRDARGNWIMPRALVESGRAGKQLDNYPFAFLAPDGKKRIETSQIYSWTDYQAIKRSIFHEHLSKAMTFHPCLAMLEAIANDAQDTLEHPDERLPEYFDKEILNTTGKGEPGEAKVVRTLESPIAEWAANDDPTQRSALSSLLNAYTRLLIDYSNRGRDAALFAELIRLVDERLWIYSENPEKVKWYTSCRETFTNALSASLESDQESREAVLGVQLSSARDYAKRRYFHKSITFYNDLLSQLSADFTLASRIDLFSNVPTTENAQKFISDLEKAIDGQWLLINVQIELAGVLNAAGLTPSAQFIWQRTIDEYEFFLRPAIDLAQGMLESYGLRSSARLKNVGQRLEHAVNECRGAIERYCTDFDWRQGINSAGDAKATERTGGSVAALRALLEKDNAGLLDDESQQKIESVFTQLTKQCVPSFRDWLELKQVLLELRPALAKKPIGKSTPLAGCPRRYNPEPEEGFGYQVNEFLVEARADQVAEWCKTPLDVANRDAAASRNSFLLAWYFSDLGQAPLVRAALVNVARVESSLAKVTGNALEGLVHESNAFSAIVEAGENTEIFDGVSAFRVDFVQLLSGQLGDWEKRWFASGNYGPHASDLRLDVEARALAIRAASGQLSREWRRDRWFFPDYTFEYGSLPDFLAFKLLYTPEWFRALDPEVVKQLGAEAVEGKRWAKIEKSDAEKFLRDLRIDNNLKKEILYLRP